MAMPTIVIGFVIVLPITFVGLLRSGLPLIPFVIVIGALSIAFLIMTVLLTAVVAVAVLINLRLELPRSCQARLMFRPRKEKGPRTQALL